MIVYNVATSLEEAEILTEQGFGNETFEQAKEFLDCIYEHTIDREKLKIYEIETNLEEYFKSRFSM